MKKIFLLLFVAFGCSCNTLPPQYSASPGRSLVQGVSSKDLPKETFSHAMLGALDPNDHTGVQHKMPEWVTHVKIFSVDGGDPLYVRGYNLGKKVWLESGIHNLTVECTTHYSWGTRGMFADVQIDVQPGYKYSLTTNPLRNESDVAKVEVIKEAIK